MIFSRLFSGESYKGTFNYLDTQRKYEIARTIIYFAVSFSLFIAGYITTGTRKNLLTVVAVLGMLPASKSLVSTYIVILQHDAVIDEIGDMLVKEYGTKALEDYLTIEDGKVKTSSLRSCIALSAEQDTEVLLISVTTKSPELSVSICNAMERVGPDKIKQVTHAGSVETIGAAKLPTSPSGPNIRRYTIIGMLAGFVIAAAIVIIRFMLDTTVRTGDDIKTRFDFPILGEIPDIEAKETKGGYYK